MDCTVVIPTRGRPELLAEAIDSVQTQTEPVAEIIVVVDGPDLVSAELATAAGCTVLVNETSMGPATARNVGVRSARTEWVAFLDDDDRWHPDRIEATVDYLADRPDVHALDAWFWLFGPEVDDTEPDMGYLEIAGQSYDLLLERNRGAINTAMVRRQLLLDAGGFPDGHVGEDWVMFLNVARLTEWHTIPRRLAYYRRWPSNTTGNAVIPAGVLGALREVWRDPRPAPPHRPLVDFGPAYRWQAQRTFWGCLRTREWRAAGRTLRYAWDLLPRWRDRAFVVTHPAITWRFSSSRRAGRTGPGSTR